MATLRDTNRRVRNSSYELCGTQFIIYSLSLSLSLSQPSDSQNEAEVQAIEAGWN
jgi:hypothetical protein